MQDQAKGACVVLHCADWLQRERVPSNGPCVAGQIRYLDHAGLRVGAPQGRPVVAACKRRRQELRYGHSIAEAQPEATKVCAWARASLL